MQYLENEDRQNQLADAHFRKEQQFASVTYKYPMAGNSFQY